MAYPKCFRRGVGKIFFNYICCDCGTRFDNKSLSVHFLNSNDDLLQSVAQCSAVILLSHKEGSLLKGIDNKNPSIYNIICWVAWTMGQTNRQPRVWCSKYYFFSWFLAKFFAKILSIYFLIFFYIKIQNKNKEFWVP